MSKFKTMIKKDIELCDDYISKNMATNAQVNALLGKYIMDYPSFNKGIIAYASVPGYEINEIENIKIIKSKLEYLLNRVDNPDLYYEDFNFILSTSIGKFCVKIFNKDRTYEDVKKYIHNAKLESDFIYDKWTITNFIKEYAEKGKYLDNKYNKIFESLVHKIAGVKFEELPTSFVHGDIISSNVMKDRRHKLWIIDFAVSNYLPRIVDLAVTSCNLCLNPESIDKTIESTKMILAEYQKYNKLTDYELACFPLFYNLANAMGILSKEDIITIITNCIIVFLCIYKFIIFSIISISSILFIAKHFLPKSFIEAPK